MFGLWLDYLLLNLIVATLVGALARFVASYLGSVRSNLLNWTLSGSYMGILFCNVVLYYQSSPLGLFVHQIWQPQMVIDWSIVPASIMVGVIMGILLISVPYFLNLNVRKLPPYFFWLISLVSVVLVRLGVLFFSS